VVGEGQSNGGCDTRSEGQQPGSARHKGGGSGAELTGCSEQCIHDSAAGATAAAASAAATVMTHYLPTRSKECSSSSSQKKLLTFDAKLPTVIPKGYYTFRLKRWGFGCNYEFLFCCDFLVEFFVQISGMSQVLIISHNTSQPANLTQTSQQQHQLTAQLTIVIHYKSLDF
jgi:hypothetical protein